MVDTSVVSKLRAQTGAGVVDCKEALDEAGGDVEKAAEILRKKGIAKAERKGERVVKQGLVHSYIHANGQVGVLVEVLCETDFVARNEQFQAFVHDIALQIAAASPLYVSAEEVPPEVVAKEKSLIAEEFAGSSKPQDIVDKIVCGKLDKYFGEICLLNQPYIKDEDITISQLLTDMIAKTGENIQISRFTRFALGEGAAVC